MGAVNGLGAGSVSALHDEDVKRGDAIEVDAVWNDRCEKYRSRSSPPPEAGKNAGEEFKTTGLLYAFPG